MTKNWINEKRYRNLSMKHPSIIKLKTFAFEYAGFIFSLKNLLTMKKFNKSYGWTPSISNSALLFSFAKYDLAMFESVMKQKDLIFINFYVFGWWILSLKVMEASSMYIEDEWDIVT